MDYDRFLRLCRSAGRDTRAIVDELVKEPKNIQAMLTYIEALEFHEHEKLQAASEELELRRTESAAARTRYEEALNAHRQLIHPDNFAHLTNNQVQASLSDIEDCKAEVDLPAARLQNAQERYDESMDRGMLLEYPKMILKAARDAVEQQNQ